MAQYAIAFDIDTTALKTAGVTKSLITALYQKEIPEALAQCGFTAHPQGSLYHTESDENPITALMQLQSILKSQAPMFCGYVRKVHVFRMEEWSDVTPLLSTRSVPTELDAEIEVQNQEIINNLDNAA
jgi:virulence-associated protein VapD